MYAEEIKVDRQSICMADDVTAPNESVIEVTERDALMDVMVKVAAYLPQIDDSVWAVDSGKEVIAYILLDGHGIPARYKLCKKNQRFLKMEIRMLHCSYFHSKGESRSLLERAEQCMKERFVEKLKIDGGSLCIWGEWFGRPHDNYHAVESVRWEKDEIQINFQEGESLFIYKPEKILNGKKKLVIGNAQKVLWVWNAYGRAQVYENMFVRQYTKDANGMILRAEGKRKDVRDGDGSAFHSNDGAAVWLG